MALDVIKLKDGLREAFSKGRETSKNHKGENELKYGKMDIAEEIAKTIVTYASDAEILILPGPLMIPGSPPVADLVNIGKKLTVSSSTIGEAALKLSIYNSINTLDSTMSKFSLGITSYIATSFINFGDNIGNTAIGSTILPIPINFIPVKSLGLGGGSEEEIIELMSAIIDSGFKTSLFSGTCTTISAGIGPVISQKLL